MDEVNNEICRNMQKNIVKKRIFNYNFFVYHKNE